MKIKETIKKMNKGDKVTFDLLRENSVRSAISKFKRECRLKKLKVSFKTISEESTKSLIVERII